VHASVDLGRLTPASGALVLALILSQQHVQYCTVLYLNLLTYPYHNLSLAFPLFFSFSFGGFFLCFVLSWTFAFVMGTYYLFQFLLCAHPSIIHPYTHAYSKIGNVTPRLWAQYGCPKSGVKKRQGLLLWWEYERLYGTVLVPYQTYLPSPDVSHTPPPLFSSCSFK